MTWMRRLGYRGLSMRDLMPYLKSGYPGAKVFGITFDDGYRNVHDHAMPVLNALGFTATNYFVARQFDGGNVWDAGKGIPYSALMSLSEMRNWAAAGHEVGSHTLDHVHLPALSPELADYQIRRSKLELEQALGAEVSAFCYPYGDESAAIRAMVQGAGYLNATTIERGLARPSDDVYGIPRVTISRSTNIVRFLQKCLTQLEDKRRRSR
jgi:peptidoglycan/xylan/chitin deacetylase (PgdA/CDA1 family)